MKVSALTILLDAVEAVLLALCFTIVAPWSSLRAILNPGMTFRYILVLLPNGLMSAYMRAMVDFKLGRADRAISTLEGVLALQEEQVFAGVISPRKILVMDNLYSRVTRLYLRLGHVDEAALAIIRAHKVTGTSKLPGLKDLDVKTAHIIKAGIAAGRMLNQGGQASILVHPPEESASTSRRFVPGPKRTRLTRAAPVTPGDGSLHQGKVIPFPGPTRG